MTNDFMQELDIDSLLRARCTVPRKLSDVERELQEFIRKNRASHTYLVLSMPTIQHVDPIVRRMNFMQMGGTPRSTEKPGFLYHRFAYKRPVMIFDWKENGPIAAIKRILTRQCGCGDVKASIIANEILDELDTINEFRERAKPRFDRNERGGP